jgi:hypothetical protein
MSSENKFQDTLKPVTRPFEVLGSFWFDRSIKIQILILAFVLLLKNGLDIELRNIQEAYLPGSLEFPNPAGYYSASFGQVIFANSLGLSNTALWVAAHVFLTVVALSLAAWFALRSDPKVQSYLLILVAAATATSAILISLGKYDVFLYMGAILLILSRSNWTAIVGAVLLASGNPEQAIVASLSLLLISFSRPLSGYRSRALIALSVSIVGWILVQIWFMNSDIGFGRLSLITEFLGESLGNFLVDPLQYIWSWFGVGWILVLGALTLMKGKDRIPVVLGLVVLPALATVVTADGARVFAAISLPAFLVVGIWMVKEKVEPSRYAKQSVGLFLALLVLLPNGLERPGWYEDQLRGRLVSVTSQIFGTGIWVNLTTDIREKTPRSRS